MTTGDKPPVYTAQEILKFLPHRYPFLLVDRVDELETPDRNTRAGRKIRAVKNVTINEPFFPGHFPHRPVMPGVLQIECMAQVGALACVNPDEDKSWDVAIVAVNDARFRRPVVPGDTLEISAEVLKDRSMMVIIKCEVRVRGQVASECEIIAKMFPLEAH